MSDTSQPVAGWYPDPENAAAERWWDGSGWTDHRRASTVPPAAPVAPAPVAPAPVPPVEQAPAAPMPPVEQAPAAYGAPTPAAMPPAAMPPAAAPYVNPYAGNPAPGSPYGAPAYVPAAPGQGNTLAVVGFVLAVGGLVVSLGGLTSLAGGVVSIFALLRANRMRQQGLPGDRWGFALAGIIAGFVIGVLVIVGLILLLSALPSLSNLDGDFSGSSYS